jgi:hypothetical protein
MTIASTADGVSRIAFMRSISAMNVIGEKWLSLSATDARIVSPVSNTVLNRHWRW